MAFAYALLLALTKSVNVGDTRWYAREIVSYTKGDFRDTGSRLWEFGHLIWRPLGYLMYRGVHWFTGGVLGWSDYLTARTSLVAISVICGLLLALTLASLARHVSGSWGVGLVTAVLLVYGHAFLTMAPAGSSYIPGLLFLALALRIGVSRLPSALWMGLSLALAVALWFPYVLSIPGVVLATFCWNRSEWRFNGPEARQRLRLLLVTLLITGAVIVLLYGTGFLVLGLHSPGDFGRWVRESQHGWTQNRTALRLVSGLPRAFISMGQDTLLFKRFALHDPYAPVTIADLALSSLWKLPLFYGAMFCLGLALLRKGAKPALAILAAGVLPVLAFALYFESGSLERFLALYPFMALAIALVLAVTPPTLTARVLLLFLVAAAIANVYDAWRPRVERQVQQDLSRARSIESVAGGGQIWLMSLADPLYWAVDAFPYEDQRGRRELRLDPVAEIGTAVVAHWRQGFARQTLQAWDSGRPVWMSKRLLAERPRPEWGWTEGDDPRVSWRALTTFTRGLATDQEVGGEDGFVRLADTPTNRHSLAIIEAGSR
jgi:hypothetical protein